MTAQFLRVIYPVVFCLFITEASAESVKNFASSNMAGVTTISGYVVGMDTCSACSQKCGASCNGDYLIVSDQAGKSASNSSVVVWLKTPGAYRSGVRYLFKIRPMEKPVMDGKRREALLIESN